MDKPMLKLEKVSKFYSANGVVTAGFSKVSLEFGLGEFVAITGESGSGKSTLLNVISGLDSYEEGEMTIFDQPTSGYSGEDMEAYRKRYIGNIFQTFNLINNYTVYQNVELVLLLSGYKRREVMARVNEIIDRVGLSKYRSTKTSKLSGGQKQRVAIARALAKETPIIVADEPTGNLDVASAADIIALLASLAKDKLIIIVTHNYEQVEPYVTRRITMHDGRVAEDKRIREAVPEKQPAAAEGAAGAAAEAAEAPERPSQIGDAPAAETAKTPANTGAERFREARHDRLSLGNTLRLGFRNTFSLPAKLLLLLFVFLFLCSGTFGAYSTFQNMNQASSDYVWSQYWNNLDARRLVLKRADGGALTEADYEKMAAAENVDTVYRNDVMLDGIFDLMDVDRNTLWNDSTGEVVNEVYMDVSAAELDRFGDLSDRVVRGRLPEKSNEAFVLLDEGYYMENQVQLCMDEDLELYVYYTNDGGMGTEGMEHRLRIVGYGYLTEEENASIRTGGMWTSGYLLGNDGLMAELQSIMLERAVTFEVTAYESAMQGGQEGVPLVVSPYVEEGEVIVPETVAAAFPYSNTYGRTIDITATNPYGSVTATFDIAAVYNAYNSNYLLDKTFNEMTQGIYMNEKDVRKFYKTENHQATVMVKEPHYIHETQAALEAEGFDVLNVREACNNEDQEMRALLNAGRTAVLFGLLLVLFFISYFIIKLIFKSQNIYFSTVRMLGGTQGSCSSVLLVELLVIFHIAFAAVAGFVYKVMDGTITRFPFLTQLTLFIEKRDFLILYGIVLVLTLLLARRYSKQMFRKTAMNAYKEEV